MFKHLLRSQFVKVIVVIVYTRLYRLLLEIFLVVRLILNLLKVTTAEFVASRSERTVTIGEVVDWTLELLMRRKVDFHFDIGTGVESFFQFEDEHFKLEVCEFVIGYVMLVSLAYVLYDIGDV